MGEFSRKWVFLFVFATCVSCLMAYPAFAQRPKVDLVYPFLKSEYNQMEKRKSRYMSIRRSCRPFAADLQDKNQSGESKAVLTEAAQVLLKCFWQARKARAELYPLVRTLETLGLDESELITKGWTLPQIIELIEWNKKTEQALLEIKELESTFPTNNQILDLLKEAGQKPNLIAGLVWRFSFVQDVRTSFSEVDRI